MASSAEDIQGTIAQSRLLIADARRVLSEVAKLLAKDQRLLLGGAGDQAATSPPAPEKVRLRTSSVLAVFIEQQLGRDGAPSAAQATARTDLMAGGRISLGGRR
jgi:hypothetical protein